MRITCIPGAFITVFGGGLTGIDWPSSVPCSMVVERACEAPSRRQLLRTEAAVSRPFNTLTLATLAELSEKPAGPSPPWVRTCSNPVTRTDPFAGAAELEAEAVKGPPPAAGSVTLGSGPDVTGVWPVRVTLTLSPKLPPPTEVTSAEAGRTRTSSDATSKTEATVSLKTRAPDRRALAGRPCCCAWLTARLPHPSCHGTAVSLRRAVAHRPSSEGQRAGKGVFPSAGRRGRSTQSGPSHLLL